MKRRRFILLTSYFLLLLLLVLAGCSGATTLDVGRQPQGYSVTMTMDPVTLNPPQYSTLDFAVTNSQNGKPVTQFQQVDGALLHGIVIRGDLGYFRHSTTNYVTVDKASVPTYFPSSGIYYTYALFQPVSSTMQVFSATVTTGQAGNPADLSNDPTLHMQESGQIPARDEGGTRVEFVYGNGNSPVKAGQPAQLLFRVQEHGVPVPMLWPYLGGPGQLWVINQDGGDFGHELGAAEVRTAGSASGATGTPGASPSGTPSAVPTGVPTSAPGASTAVAGAPQQGAISTAPVPTLVPAVQAAFATLTAQPAATLLPAQQTALTSIMGTPAVLPSVGYGPVVVFTHTFARAGLYKLWFEYQYLGLVYQADFVLRVGQ